MAKGLMRLSVVIKRSYAHVSGGFIAVCVGRYGQRANAFERCNQEELCQC